MHHPRYLTLLACLLFVTPASAQLPPDKALASMQPGAGLQVELFASEPMFSNPTSMDIDHKGRVWICEAVNYRRRLRGQPPLRKEGDRIVIVEDTDGDGKADKSHVFYQSPEVEAPLGIAVAPYPDGKGQKVYVCQSPNIWVFQDKDGDLKADGKPEVLLTGFRGIDHDHGVHGILIGPDGKLYFTVGDQGVQNLQSADGKGRKWTSNNTDCRAGTVWRCDMDGTNLELIAHNFRNNYEPAVDSFGTIFLSDNDDDGNQQTRICYVMPGGNYGYHPRGRGESHWHEEQPGIVHKVLRTYFGSPTGMCFYEGTMFPEQYRGQLLHTDAGPRHLRCYHITPAGAGYKLEQEVMLTSSDNWFRPSDVCVAPDGSILVADWYDPGVGGHGMGDTTRGRIYRVTPEGHKGYKVPEVDLVSKEGESITKGIIPTLPSPNLATRHMALAKFRSLPLSGASLGHFMMDAALANTGVEPRTKEIEFGQEILNARFLWIATEKGLLDILFDRWKEKGLQRGDRSASFTNSQKSNEAVQLIRLLSNRFPGFEGIPSPILDWLREKSLSLPASARREILLPLRKTPVEKAKIWFYPLAKHYDGNDHFYLAALNIACGTDPERRKAILADFDKHFPEWNDKVADLVWELRPPSVLPRLEKLLTDQQLSDQQRARIVDILSSSDDPNAGKSMINLVASAETAPEVRDAVLDNLRKFLPNKWRDLRNSPEMGKAINTLLKDSERIPVGLTLAAVAERRQVVPDVSALALNEKTALPLRKQAVATLGQLNSTEAVNALEKVVDGGGALAVDAVKALGDHIPLRGESPTSKDALKSLQQIIMDKNANAEMKQTAISALAGSYDGTVWLLDSKENNKLPKAVVADAGRFLRNSPFQGLRNRALIAFPPAGRLDPKKLPGIDVLAKKRGNVERGRRLMMASMKNESQCMRCHMIRAIGGQIGPDLSMIGKKASRENLYESILNPSKAIADQYIQEQITTFNGQLLVGLVVGEDDDSVTLRDANGKDVVIPKKDIDEREKLKTSIMPEDLVVTLTEADLIDMVEYLFTLKNPALTLETWHIVGPFDNGEGDAGLDKAFGPEEAKAVDLSASYSSKSSSVKWRIVHPDSQGYVDLQAFHAPASNQIVSYLYRKIESPIDQEVEILLGTDDGAKLWVNDELVFQTRAHRAAAPAQDTVTATLKKGTNKLLLKIVNGDGPHGFYLTILSSEELKPIEKK